MKLWVRYFGRVMESFFRLVLPYAAILVALAASCCLHPGGEDAGFDASSTSGISTTSGSSSGASMPSGGSGTSTNSGGSTSGTSGSGGTTSATGDSGISCGGPGIGEFCDDINVLGPDPNGFGPGLEPYCLQEMCPACSTSDSQVIEPLPGDLHDAGSSPSFLTCPDGLPAGYCLCPGAGGGDWDVSVLDCLVEAGPMVLSPTCAAALISVVQANAVFPVDGGSGGACWYEAAGGLVRPASVGRDFCSAVGSCVGGIGYCEGAICGACNAGDAFALGGDGGAFPGTFFGGLCPPLSSASPCADLECLVDAGAKILSPSCAAAVTSLAERFLDGGLDGG
jgi:hypothetical protein